MIILGIDTATPQVGCAVGGHEARWPRSTPPRAAATPRPWRRPSSSSASRPGSTSTRSASSPSTSAPGCSPACGSAWPPPRPWPPPSGADDRSHQPRPAGLSRAATGRLIAAMVDARRGEVFWALYRQVPGGVQRLTDYAVSRPDEVASELMARGEDVPGPRRRRPRYAGLLGDVAHVEVGRRGQRLPVGGVLVELAQPAGAAEEFVQPETAPLYLRSRDVRINWESATAPSMPSPGATVARWWPASCRADVGSRGPADADRGPPGADAPPPPAVGAADRSPGVPPAVVVAAVHERAQPAHQPGLLRGPGRRRRRRLRRPDADRRRRPRHDHRGRPGLAPPQDRHPPAAQPGPRGGAPGRRAPHPGGPGQQHAAPRPCTGSFGFRPAGVRKNYYVETNEDALVMWADDIDTEYQARLADIEAGIPGAVTDRRRVHGRW